MAESNNIEILNYCNGDFNDYKNIGTMWLKEYDLYEPEDELILNNPNEYILDNGGIILMAKFDNIAVGSIALINRGNMEYEIGKFGVLKEFRGLGIGKLLIKSIITMAKDRNLEKIILYTNSKLKAAQKLYLSLGFIVLDEEVFYDEADIKMEITLLDK